ncbi:uracil-DNA glycosylase family protein, partial [Candidatus Uhrbacteria bacterium]|nr:uracil-DNA glycosylase family protein [Candidatus Uhrbacteria bacterium]
GSAAIERFLGPGTLEGRVGTIFDVGGAKVVPLPHPSGANLWLNRPESQTLLRHATEHVRHLRGALGP